MATLDPAHRQPGAKPRLTVMDGALIGTVLVHGVAGPAGGLGITTPIIASGLLRTPTWDRVAPIERLCGHHGSWLQPLTPAVRGGLRHPGSKP